MRALCVTEIVSWGVLYYAFPVLADTVSTRQGWPHTALTAAFSLGLLVSAAAGIPAGRIMQRYGPRWLMPSASTLAVAAVLLIAAAPNLLVFFTGWVLAGVAMSGVLYAPAFAAVTVWFGEDRVRALTAITLIAGLASTVFAPLTAALDDHLGWRVTYVSLAIALAVITIPAHWFALRPAWPNLPARALSGVQHSDDVLTETAAETPPSRSAVALLATAFTLSTVGVYAAVVNFVPLLAERGFSAGTASVVLGIGGIGQVAGRLGYTRLARHITLKARTAGVLAASAVATALLGLIPGPLWLLIVASMLAGNARGIFTLVQATAVSDRWGVRHYARVNGVFGAPIMAASALAPFIGSGLASLLGSYSAAFVALAIAGAGAVAFGLHPAAQVMGPLGEPQVSNDRQS